MPFRADIGRRPDHVSSVRRLTAIVRLARAPFAIASAGCFPVLAHGPDVEAGFRTGLATSLHVADAQSPAGGVATRMVPWPAVATYAAYGFTGTNVEGPRARIAAHFTTAGEVAADVYAELPRRWTGAADGGAGLFIEEGPLRAAMPYLMFGPHSSGAPTWHLTQGAIIGRLRTAGDWSVLSVTTFTIVRERPSGRASIYTTAIFGPQETGCVVADGCRLGWGATRLIVGTALERRPRGRVPAAHSIQRPTRSRASAGLAAAR